MRIIVKDVTGREERLNVEPTDHVDNVLTNALVALGWNVATTAKTLARMRKLVFRGRMMETHKQLSDYHVSLNDTLNIDFK